MGLDPVSIIADSAAKIIALFKTNPTVKLENEFQLQEDVLKGQISEILSQIQVNAVEAANPNWFVAGARPAILWICALGLFVQFIVNPVSTWVAALLKHPVAFPTLDMGSLMTLLIGLLGLSGMRTYEKLNNAQGNH